jgi:hypothetical protein
MLRALLEFIRDAATFCGSESRPISNRPRRYRPTLELLEDRQLLSGLSLDGVGNLSEQTAAGIVVIDHNVTSYAVDSAGWVFDVNRAGSLGRFATGSTTRLNSDSNVLQIAANGDGWIFVLHQGGTMDRWQSGGAHWPVVDSYVAQIVTAGDGTVFDRHMFNAPDGTGGQLLRWVGEGPHLEDVPPAVRHPGDRIASR